MRQLTRSSRQLALCLASVFVLTLPAIAGPSSGSTKPAPPKAPPAPVHEDKHSKPPRPKCAVGQVRKWDGQHWVCANDLVGGGSTGGGSGAQMVDANNVSVGTPIGTAVVGGVTVPTLLVTLADSPTPFLFPADAGGFVTGGRLLVRTTNEGLTCGMSCGLDQACLGSCLSASSVCDPANVLLEPLPAVSPLFRTGAIIDATPARAELWAPTSSTTSAVGECLVSQGIPFCLRVLYQPSSDTCTMEIGFGDDTQTPAYPAALLVNLHALHPPPYVLRAQ